MLTHSAKMKVFRGFIYINLNGYLVQFLWSTCYSLWNQWNMKQICECFKSYIFLSLICKPNVTMHLPNCQQKVNAKEEVNLTFYQFCCSKISRLVINRLENHYNINSGSWYTVLRGLTVWQIWLINPLNWPMTHSTAWLKREYTNRNTTRPSTACSVTEKLYTRL